MTNIRRIERAGLFITVASITLLLFSVTYAVKIILIGIIITALVTVGCRKTGLEEKLEEKPEPAKIEEIVKKDTITHSEESLPVSAPIDLTKYEFNTPWQTLELFKQGLAGKDIELISNCWNKTMWAKYGDFAADFSDIEIESLVESTESRGSWVIRNTTAAIILAHPTNKEQQYCLIMGKYDECWKLEEIRTTQRKLTAQDYSYALGLKEELQKLKKAGIPTTLEELALPKIPDEENAAFVYKEAAELKESLEEKYKDEWKLIPYEGDKKWDELTEEEKRTVVDLILHNPYFVKMYQLLEKASQMKCRFLTAEDYRKGVAMQLPQLGQLRSYARLLAAKAKIEAEYGKIDDSLSASLTGLRIAGSLSNEPIVISQLVRNAMDQIALSTLEEPISKGEGSELQYQSLINEVREERESKLTQHALKGEMVICGMQQFSKMRGAVKAGAQDQTMEMIEGEDEELMKLYSENPEAFVDVQQATYLKVMREMISLTGKSYWEVKEELENLDNEIQKLPSEKAALTQMLVPALSKAYNRETRVDAMLGNAELALAVKIYDARNGYFPTDLSELVSAGIITELPKDPFTGKDYVYKKKDNGFAIYSLGDNAKDDGGLKVKRYEGDFDIVWEVEK